MTMPQHSVGDDDLWRLADSLSLAHQKPDPCGHPVMGAVPDGGDRRFVLMLLGDGLARSQIPLRGRNPMASPLVLIVDRLFMHWVRRGCEGAIVAPPASGTLVWKKRPNGSQPLYRHWSVALISAAVGHQAVGGIYGSHLDIYRPWRTMRGDVDVFLDAVAARLGLDEIGRTSGDEAGAWPSRLGVKCLVLRNMAILVPGRVPAVLADRLDRLRIWLDQQTAPEARMAAVYPTALLAQRAAWERYLLDRTVGATRRRVGPVGDGTDNTGLVRRRAM